MALEGQMEIFLGIEGGGSRTVALVGDSKGRILGRGEIGPSNPLNVGLAGAKRALYQSARAAIRGAGVRSASVHTVCLGLAGIGRVEMERPLRDWIKKVLPARRHILGTDADVTFYTALGRNPGILVVAGTGSIALGRDERGKTARAGGWGCTYDDAGSGFDIGRKAVAASLRAFDERGPKTRLQAHVCGALRLADISRISSRNLTPSEVASLFPLVVKLSRKSDRVAKQILMDAAEELAELVLAVARNFQWQRGNFRIVATGGVFHHSDVIYRRFHRILRCRLPGAKVSRYRGAAAEAALRMAIETSTVALSQSGESPEPLYRDPSLSAR